jgi:hypothetical protein
LQLSFSLRQQGIFSFVLGFSLEERKTKHKEIEITA